MLGNFISDLILQVLSFVAQKELANRIINMFQLMDIKEEITEIYLKYSIQSLNIQGEVPIIYSDIDYFKNLDLIYDWVELSLPDRYRKSTIWSYPKLKVLAINGYYDLATPFYAAEYTFAHMGLEKRLQNNIIFNFIP